MPFTVRSGVSAPGAEKAAVPFQLVHRATRHGRLSGNDLSRFGQRHVHGAQPMRLAAASSEHDLGAFCIGHWFTLRMLDAEFIYL